MRQTIRDLYDIEGHEFAYVCRIAPKSDPQGRPIEVQPQARYANLEGLRLHQYGHGPFCAFSVERGWEGKAGVYAFLVDGEVKYVGECEDLATRINMGYGRISPRNCYQGGQQTNCRINNLVLEAVKGGSQVTLIFHQNEHRRDLESVLLQRLSPDWNRSGGRLELTVPKRGRAAVPRGSTRSQQSLGTTCRDEVVKAAQAIIAEKGQSFFTIQEVVDYLMLNGTTYSEATIRTHIASRCCVNAPNHHAVTYADFERVDRGRYRLVR